MKYIILCVILAGPASAQTPFNFVAGQPLPAASLNAAGALKTDVANGSTTNAMSSSGTALQTLASRFGERISVRDFGAACDGVADDSAHLAAAATALRGSGRAIHIPGNCRILMAGAAQPWLKGVAIVADGLREYTAAGNPSYGQMGGTIIIAAALTGSSPFVVSDGWAFRGVNVFWAGQTEAAAAANSGNPVAYPALFSEHSTDAVVNWEISNCQIENAYDVIDLSGTTNVGFFHFDKNLVYAMHRVISVLGVGGESYITDNDFSPEAYYFGVRGLGTSNLETYASLNEDIFYGTGNGTHSTGSSTPIAGVHMTQNYFYEANHGIHLVGGRMNLSSLVGNSFDTVPTPMEAGTGGSFQAVTVTGGTWLAGLFNSTTSNVPALLVSSTAAPNNSLTLAGVEIAAVAGKGIEFDNVATVASQNNSLVISGGSVSHVGNVTGAFHDGIDLSITTGTTVIISGVQINTSNAGATSAFGINIIGGTPSAIAITGNVFTGFENPINTTQTGGHCAISGNVSYGSLAGGGASVTGAGASNCTVSADNVWG